jgi:hypothetical protein
MAILATAFVGPYSAQATLINRGGGLIYDTDLDVTWTQELSFTTYTWSAAVAWAESLEYYDPVRDVTWSDWRLPHADLTVAPDGVTPCSTSEMGHVYWDELGMSGNAGDPGPFVGWPQANHASIAFFWCAEPYGGLPGGDPGAYGQNLYGGAQGAAYDVYWASYRAWAVRDGDVPEPATGVLLITGAAGVLLRRRRA